MTHHLVWLIDAVHLFIRTDLKRKDYIESYSVYMYMFKVQSEELTDLIDSRTDI